MKHGLQKPFYRLIISVPSTYVSFTVCRKRKKTPWFLIQSGPSNEKMGVQDIIN